MPSPTASAAAMNAPMASAQSTAVLRNVSRLLFACGIPCRSHRRCPRRMSPHHTRKTGALAIQSIVPIQSATCLIRARSRITTTEYCCKSDFAGADCAAASSPSSSGSGTSWSV